MIHRFARKIIVRRLKVYPAVALLGPRQCGKTTLAKTFSDRYFDLEQEGDRTRIDVMWDKLSASGQKRLMILDEAQAFPAIFPRIRSAIDSEPKRKGRFLILGSVSPSLMKHVSESLAGRLSLVNLCPFIIPEIKEKRNAIDRLWLCGGFPDGGILDSKHYPQWQKDYLALLSQRDLPNWGLPAKPQLTDRLFAMLAVLNGQILNTSGLSSSLGITHPTLGTYLDYLEGAFLLRRLQPFAANLKKRIVKSPKIYLRDTGLLHALLNVSDFDSLLQKPWIGASWESFVVEQITSFLDASGVSYRPYFFRTHDNYECDLILDFGNRLYAIEIKLTSSPSTDDLNRLDKIGEMLKADKRILLSRCKTTTESRNLILCNLPVLLDKLLDNVN